MNITRNDVPFLNEHPSYDRINLLAEYLVSLETFGATWRQVSLNEVQCYWPAPDNRVDVIKFDESVRYAFLYLDHEQFDL